MVISVKIRNFSRSQMTKWTSSLELSAKSSYPVEFCQIPRQSEFHVFRDNEGSAGHLARFEWLKRCHMSCAELVKYELMCGQYELTCGPWVDA